MVVKRIHSSVRCKKAASPISENLLIGSQCVTRDDVEVGIYFIMSSADLGGSLCLW